MLIQIIATIFIILIIFPSLYSYLKRENLTLFGFLIWVLFWILAIVIIWNPGIIVFIGNTLGVERSIDALIYIAIILLLFSTMSGRIKINHCNREITELVREYATNNVKKPTQNESEKE